MATARDTVAPDGLHGAAQPRAMAFQRFKVKRHGIRPLVFDGALLAEHSVALVEGVRQTVRIWETSGPFVLQIEQTQSDADEEDGSGSSFVHVCHDADAVRAAMDAFDPSHALSDQMGRLLTCPVGEVEAESEAYATALAAADTHNTALMQAFNT